MKITAKIKLVFLILEECGAKSDHASFLRYESNSAIGGASFANNSRNIGGQKLI